MNAAAGPGWTEEERLSAVAMLAPPGARPSKLQTDILRSAAIMLEAESAAIFVVDRDTQRMLAGVAASFTSMPRSWSICEHAFHRTSPLVVPDTRADPRFASNPLVTAEPGLRFYAGAAVRTRQGVPLGGLCVFSSHPRTTPVTDHQAHLLSVLADQVGLQLEVERLDEAWRGPVDEDDAPPVGRRPPFAVRDDGAEFKRPTAAAPTLTPQQVRVLCWAARGKSAPEIAMILGLTPRTVRFHLSAASARLGATRTSQAVAIALSRDLIPAP